MPVTTTVQEILDGAYNRSGKNRVGATITDATEGVKLVHRSLRGLYSYAARINPIYFAESAAVSFAAGGWTRPQVAESIYRIELPSTAEVAVVPYDDRVECEPSMPAVYEFGQVFRSAGSGNGLDPVSGNLTFFYARGPTLAPNLASTLDAQWAEQFNELLMLEVAIYMALKDSRMDEVAVLQAERDVWVKLFTAFLEHATANERRRFSQVRRFLTNTIVPLRSLLAGGGS